MRKRIDMKTNPITNNLEGRITHKILLNKSQAGDANATAEVNLIRQERQLAQRMRNIRQQERHKARQARRKNPPVT